MDEWKVKIMVCCVCLYGKIEREREREDFGFA